MHQLKNDFLETYYLGPPIDEGPMPTLFYFALSAEESLQLDPFNQPAVFCDTHKMRIFSVTLPGHGTEGHREQAIDYWMKALKEGIPLLQTFQKQFCSLFKQLESSFHQDKIGFMGLSRGGFISLFLAAKLPQVKVIVNFAPLTDLTYCSEYKKNPFPMPNELNLQTYLEELYQKTIRFYIGNRDERVNTDSAFFYLRELANHAFTKRIRSSPIELIMSSSHGFQGHGTLPPTFKDGALWIQSKLISS